MEVLKEFQKAMAAGDIDKVVAIASSTAWSEGDRPTLTRQQLAEIRLEVVDWLAERPALAQAITLCSMVLQAVESDKGSDPFLIASALDRLAELYQDGGQLPAAAEAWKRAIDLMEPIEGRDSDAVLWRIAKRVDVLEKCGHARIALELRQELEDRTADRLAGVNSTRLLNRGPKPADASNRAFELIKVHFGTHRSRTGRNNPYDYFRGGRNASMTYGNAVVSVPVRREIGSLPRPPRWMKEDRANPDHYFVIKSMDTCSERSCFFAEITDALRAAEEREALIFVHGYNTSFASAVLRTGQLAADLELDGAAILYSWPSKGTVLSYLTDKNEAIAPYIRDLKDLIRDVAVQTGASKVHLVAHSLGGEFLLKALEGLTTELQPTTAPPFREIVFASPDVDSLDFRDRLPRVQRLGRRTTVYSSNTDMALQFSEWVNGSSRAGSVVFDGIVEFVQTSGSWPEGFGHSDYATSAIDDLRAVVWLSLQPSRRRTLREMRTAAGRYWLCDPGILSQPELTAVREAMSWTRRLGATDAMDVLSKLVSSPAMHSEEVERRKVHLAILEELRLLHA